LQEPSLEFVLLALELKRLVTIRADEVNDLLTFGDLFDSLSLTGRTVHIFANPSLSQNSSALCWILVFMSQIESKFEFHINVDHSGRVRKDLNFTPNDDGELTYIFEEIPS